ncbi:D-alanyl-D-alanine carboxypeptidase family protein [Streptomyces xiaopingdaonensis]|uniref:D-alanyl-D-alanine carboxypeptidase family protein n=1 Tax=Streptomyces xiaopingdaonensis TaxID=1565415 RepID=UPI00030F4B79|nr:serine hydrolase [Streptomyces xiaopingdaonensis]
MGLKSLSRRKIIAAAIGGVVLTGTPLAAWAGTSAAPPPEIAAKGAILVDDSGESIYGKNENTDRFMASTVKIMATSLVLDKQDADLDRKVPVDQAYRDYVTEHHTSTADLQTGDKMTVRQLLYAALLPSGADAVYALADTFGQGATRAKRVQSFVADMNAKAQDMDLGKTEFDTFDGTGDDSTSPADLAKLAQHAMQNPTFSKIVGTKKHETEAPAANGNTRYYTWNNTNALLGSYKGVTGIKTGTTSKAGACLVFSAERDGETLTGVVLNSEDRNKDAAKLLDYGFGTDEASDMKLRKLPSDAQND